MATLSRLLFEFCPSVRNNFSGTSILSGPAEPKDHEDELTEAMENAYSEGNTLRRPNDIDEAAQIAYDNILLQLMVENIKARHAANMANRAPDATSVRTAIVDGPLLLVGEQEIACDGEVRYLTGKTNWRNIREGEQATHIILTEELQSLVEETICRRSDDEKVAVFSSKALSAHITGSSSKAGITYALVEHFRTCGVYHIADVEYAAASPVTARGKRTYDKIARSAYIGHLVACHTNLTDVATATPETSCNDNCRADMDARLTDIKMLSFVVEDTTPSV